MKGTDRIKREVLESMDWTEGHSDCRIGRVEKSKPEAERSRDMAEKMGKAEFGKYRTLQLRVWKI